MKHRTRAAKGASVANGGGHVVGLDLGATAVRATVLTPKSVKGRTTVTVHRLGSVPLPDGAVVNGVVINGAAVTAALKQLWSEHKLGGRTVVLGATNQQVAVRDFTVPHLPREQLKKTLPYQARDVIALPLDQALLDFSPLGPPSSDNTVAGLLTAIPSDPVVRAVQAVEKAKLTVARVDLAPFGLLRSLGTAGPAIEALIDIGAHLTTIVIHANGIAKVVRVVKQGGAAWTAYLADQADLPQEEAEATKRSIGITGTTLAAKLLREAIRPAVNEIRSSVNFFTAQHRVTVERVLVTGGSAALPGLLDHLHDQLGAPVDAAPFSRHLADSSNAVDATTRAAASAISVGLAMGVAA